MAEEEIAQEAVRNPSEEWFISILDGQQPDPEARSKHRIPKAPAKFRDYEKDKKYFDPRVVSLGPYHHGKDHLEPMEKYKITAAKQFFDRFTNVTGGRGGIYKKFKESTGKLKECYDAEVVAKMSNDIFARMMFLDGCFVLHFIQNNLGGKTKLEISNDLIPLIIWDIFLIENQLPFEVLDVLMNLRWGSSSKGKEKILIFIGCKVLIPMGSLPQHYKWLSNWLKAHDRSLHLLDVLRTILLGFTPSNGAEKHSGRPRNIGSVMELKETGIRFEKRRTKSSMDIRFESRRMKSLMDIRFEEHLLFPRLLIPTMVINHTTISQLLNLTALEAWSDTYSGCGVTSFINFMDSLIKDDADVKELRSKGILHHSLGSDDEVARLFSTWPADVTNDLELYRDINMQILWHRKKTVKIYMAKLVEKYFVAASLILVLTVIQTYFAAFPRR